MAINTNIGIAGRLFNRAGLNVSGRINGSLNDIIGNLTGSSGNSGSAGNSGNSSSSGKSAGAQIDQFKSRMSSFARPNLFEVVISNPKKKGVLGRVQQRLSFACYQATIPGMSIATTDKDQGYRSMAYQKIYEDVTLGFYVHGDMKELKVFQDWMQIMIDPTDNHVGYYDDYIATVEIKNLDRQQHKVLTTTLIDAYPKTLETISLDAGANDDVMKVNVVFTYRTYKQEFGGRQETTGESLGSFTERSAEDIPEPLSDMNTLRNKTGNLVTKNKQGFFVPQEHRINQ